MKTNKEYIKRLEQQYDDNVIHNMDTHMNVRKVFVRCKDCKHVTDGNCQVTKICRFWRVSVPLEHFCGLGERV